MITAQNIGVHFAGNYLFQDVNFTVKPKDKIGLAGKNGAGKSTLLKILAKQQTSTEGDISMEGNISVGFLQQDLDFNYGETVWNETQKAFTELNSIETKLKKIEEQFTQRTDYESQEYLKLIEEHAELTEQYSNLDGIEKDAETEKILKGLGFQSSDFHRLTDEFSGGWRMRIELAKLLLQKHDVLLLDEPTNHLDIDSILWFEQYLKNFTGAVILVSHDIEFLSNLTNRTIEISNQSIQDYKANYQKFLVLRKERKEKLLQAQKNQEQYVKHTEQLINKFRAKQSKASMAQSLIKKLDKLERIEVEDEDITKFNIQFQTSVRPGKVIFHAEGLSKKYDQNTVFSNANFYVEREEKIAFVGQNGQGKTTLAKILADIIPKTSGNLKTGHNVEIGYFAQNQKEVLNPNNTVLQEAENAATEETRKNVRNLLGNFLFSGEDVEKKVKVLSGGERNRLALCKLLLKPFNTLILDEPTNHLDIHSKEIIKKALQDFKGTLILVSHDRQFLEGLCHKTFEFKEGRIKEYLGGIKEYLEDRQAQSMREIEKSTITTQQANKNNTSEDIDFKIQKRKKKLENKLHTIESQIEELEKHNVQLEQNFFQENPSQEQLDLYKDNQKKIQEKLQLWEETAKNIEHL